MLRLEVILMSLSYNLLPHTEARARFSLGLFLLLFSRDNDSLVIMSSPQKYVRDSESSNDEDLSGRPS